MATLSTEQRTIAGALASIRPHAVVVRDVSKTFRLPHLQAHTLKERALHPFRFRDVDELHAVREVSFEVAEGEMFGIVGRNGSGKSTLLKCLAGIYRIDAGDLEIHGRLSPFIELGVGFNPDLTARDNVIINAIMLGLSRKEAQARFDTILAFAELEEFVDLKLKNYSSGMYVRLAFATAVQVDADILIIDEVLAVGDAAFQQKCFDEFTRLKAAGRTILFVTHDMGAVERFCDRAMLIEAGSVVEIGEPASIARAYNRLNFGRERQEPVGSNAAVERLRSAPQAEILSAWFESVGGEVVVTANQGEPCVLRMDVRFHAEVENPLFAMTLMDQASHAVFTSNTDAQQIATGSFDAGATASIRVQFDNYLAPGRYTLIASVARAGFGADVLDAHMRSTIIVLAERPAGALVDLPNTLEIERS